MRVFVKSVATWAVENAVQGAMLAVDSLAVKLGPSPDDEEMVVIVCRRADLGKLKLRGALKGHVVTKVRQSA